MPEGKRQSFILYCDSEKLINKLTDEEAGRLIKAIFDYVSTGVIPENLSEKADLVFMTVQNYLDRDAEKWDNIRRERAEAGRKGGLESGKTRLKQSQANEANASTSKQNEANEAVNVSVSVPVTGSVNETDSVSVTEPVTVISFDKSVSEKGYGEKLLSYEPDAETKSSVIQGSTSYRPLTDTEFEKRRDEQMAKLRNLPKSSG